MQAVHRRFAISLVRTLLGYAARNCLAGIAVIPG
jgi:hypothetical protein